MTTTTHAAKRFLDAIAESWDSLTPYAATAEAGELSEIDSAALEVICDETGEDYDEAHADVVTAIMAHVAAAQG
jgi:hypothetical protein